MDDYTFEQKMYKLARDSKGFLVKSSDAKGLIKFENAVQPYFAFPGLCCAFSFAIKVLYNLDLPDIVSAMGGTIGFGMSTSGTIHPNEVYDYQNDYQIDYNGDRVNLAYRAVSFAHKWHIWIVGEEKDEEKAKWTGLVP